MKNNDFVHSFINAEDLDKLDVKKCGNLSIRGNVLYSYAEPIALRLFNYSIHLTTTKFSQTTSRHCNLVKINAEFAGFLVNLVDSDSLKNIIQSIRVI
jgi:hypothetical protein